MQQPDSINNNPMISDRLRLLKPSLWPENLRLGYLLLMLFLLINFFDFEALTSFFHKAVQQGPAGIPFWMPLAAFSGLTWLAIDLMPTVFSKLPKQYRKQRIPVWADCFQTVVVGICIISFLIGLLLFFSAFFHSPDHRKPTLLVLSMCAGLLILSGAGYLLYQYGNQALQPFVNLWRRVSITGYFDKETYKMGDTILFQLRDRLTMTDEHLYRVHFQHVNEYEQSTGTGESVKKKLIRHVRYHEFRDVSGVALYAGIRLSTDEPQRLNLKGNRFSKNFPDYWEVLVEEHGGEFYARFFVGLR